MSRLFTFGHGTAATEEIARLIEGAGLELVMDVRTVPRSRRHPQFWREAMQAWIPDLTSAQYVWNRSLGGFRKGSAQSHNIALRHPSFRAYADYMETPEFRDALAGLLSDSAEKRTAIMCSETLWWRCHRRLISDAATLLHGVEVLHLMHDGTEKPHLPTAGVRVVDGMLRYDVTGEA